MLWQEERTCYPGSPFASCFPFQSFLPSLHPILPPSLIHNLEDEGGAQSGAAQDTWSGAPGRSLAVQEPSTSLKAPAKVTSCLPRCCSGLKGSSSRRREVASLGHPEPFQSDALVVA